MTALCSRPNLEAEAQAEILRHSLKEPVEAAVVL